LAAVRAPQQRTEVEAVRSALHEDYEVMEEIGRGGMAIVYRARERLLDREVAIKVLPFALAHDAEFVERFQREARTAAKLEHPHIVPVYRVGQRDSVIYFAMRYLRGKSLSEIVDERGALPPSVIRKLLVESSKALGYAHKHGIVHRDIKPDNIMFRENGEAVLCDFGIAKAATGTRLTGTGTAIGTPYYMSPEQARAQPLDGRSDLYSLGVVAYQCLTGQVPFDGEDSFSIGYKHVMEEVPRPELSTDEERHLFAVIQRMMAKDPGERYQTAEDVAGALTGGTGTSSSMPATGPRPASPPLKFAPTPTTPMPRPSVEKLTQAGGKKKSRTGVLVGAIMALGALGGGTIYVVASSGDAPSAEEQTTTTDQQQTAVALDGPETRVDTTSATVPATTDSVIAAPESTETEVTPPDEPTTGVLTLAGNLGTNARISIDGRRVSGTDHTLTPGMHAVRIERPGYERYTDRVNVAGGQTIRLRVNLVAERVEPAPEPEPVTRRPRSQCAEFDPETYNANGSCYSTAPTPQTAPLVPIPQSVSGTPTPVIVVVEVFADGTVGVVLPRQPSNESDFTVAAIQFAKQMRYEAATDANGNPVRAFKQEVMQPQPRY
jgi:serine/threonine protein kinase